MRSPSDELPNYDSTKDRDNAFSLKQNIHHKSERIFFYIFCLHNGLVSTVRFDKSSSKHIMAQFSVTCKLSKTRIIKHYIHKVLRLLYSQDLLENEDISLDWFFKYSIMMDIANVSEHSWPIHGCVFYLRPMRITSLLVWDLFQP